MRNINFGKPILGTQEYSAVQQVLESGILVHGPKAKEFEQKFTKFVGGGHSVSVGSATAGLHLAYFNRELGEGDEVIVPAQTHVATAHSVELVGAKPVFVDAELETGNIDIDQIESHITERTRAISVVHYLGRPVQMDRILEIAKKKDLFVIEDCALSVGGKYKGVHTGLWGDAGCFSFYPVKHFTTGEGGVFLTRHQKIAEEVGRQKAFGLDRTVGERKVPGIYDVVGLGFNYRMNEIAAVLGIHQLDRVEGFLTTREQNYLELKKGIQNISEIKVLSSHSEGDIKASYYCLSFLLNDRLATKREEVIAALNAQGVGTSVYYPGPVPMFKYYKEKYNFSERDYPNACAISRNSIALPVGPHLNTEDMKYIATALKEVVSKVK